MACSINKTKHLYWCMMLAMIVVLIWVLNGPKIMVKMIVAGSSATQHTSSEKRQLRSSSYMTAKINGGEEERMNFDFVLPDLNLPALSEDVTEAMEIGEEHVATMLTVDENVKRVEIAGLLKWAKELKQLNPKEHIKAASAKLIERITKKGEEAISTPAAAKHVLSSESDADIVNNAILLEQIYENRGKNIFNLLQPDKNDLTTILASPLLNIYYDVYPKEARESLFPRLFDVLITKFKEKGLTEKLVLAQSNDATRQMARIFVKYHMIRWRDIKNYSGDNVWNFLELEKAGIKMFDRPLWKVWITYLAWLKNAEVTSGKFVISMLRKKFENDDLLSKWFAEAPQSLHTEEGKKTAASLSDFFVEAIKETTSATKRHQRNVDEASASTQRQRVSNDP